MIQTMHAEHPCTDLNHGVPHQCVDTTSVRRHPSTKKAPLSKQASSADDMHRNIQCGHL